jgi:hypothetical protein
MSLFDLMGPLAIVAGASGSYAVQRAHGGIAVVSIVVGVVVGVCTVVGFHRAIAKAPDRLLLAFYVAMPVGVLAATVLGSWVVRASLS